jgi:hypothetical protein
LDEAAEEEVRPGAAGGGLVDAERSSEAAMSPEAEAGMVVPLTTPDKLAILLSCSRVATRLLRRLRVTRLAAAVDTPLPTDATAPGPPRCKLFMNDRPLIP